MWNLSGLLVLLVVLMGGTLVATSELTPVQAQPQPQPPAPPPGPPGLQVVVQARNKPWVPLDTVGAVYADLQTVQPGLQQYCRYLELGDLPLARVEMAVRILNGHVNSLSRNPELRPLAVVGPTLLRLNFKDYRWALEVYEKLADADPYWHTKVKEEIVEEVKKRKVWPGGVWHEDNKYYPPGAFTYTDGEKVKVKKIVVKETALAPWLVYPEEEKQLREGKLKNTDTKIGKIAEITQSRTPILFGHWFFQQTAIQEGRDPGYYDFLGIKDEKAFEQLIGFNEKESILFSDIWREAVARSKVVVGKRPRRIERFDKPKSGYWRTRDAKITKDDKNPLRVLDDALKFDAVESFGSLGNGMMAWFLGNNKGVRQNAAPDFIASDQSGAANDSRVHINANCIRCHSNAGIKDFDQWARTLFRAPRGLEIPAYADDKTYEQLNRLRVQYLRHLEPNIESDRLVYIRAIWESTGLKAEQWSKEYYKFFEEYIEAEVDVNWAARALGTTPELLQKALAHVKKTTGQIDPVAATFLKPPALSISIESFEEIYPILQTYIRGYSPQ